MLSWHNKTKRHGNMLYPNRIKLWVQFLKITGIGTVLDILSESLNIIECNHMFQLIFAVMAYWKNGYMWRPLSLGGNCLLSLSHLEYSVNFIKVTSFVHMHSYEQCIIRWLATSLNFTLVEWSHVWFLLPCVCVCMCMCMCVCGVYVHLCVCVCACAYICMY